MATVLVIGATGIHAPAAAALVARGDTVFGVARCVDGMPEGVEPIVADAMDPRSLSLSKGVDSALVYAPAVSDESLAALREHVTGRVVLVRVSAAADPSLGPLEVPADVLQLGWFDGEPDAPASTRSRWHTPAEVSAAALEVLADGVGRVLGAVRPWEHKP